MKLFQIEEPDGSPLDSAEGPGAAVGIDLAGAVAVAMGGNAEVLVGRDGLAWSAPASLGELLPALKARAEQALARPVTHAVVVADKADAATRAAVSKAGAPIGLAILRLMTRAEAAALAKHARGREAAVLGAAIRAEEVAPRPAE